MVTVLTGDCREVLAGLPAGEFQTCVTSPPYFGLRDYGHDGQIGLEPTPDAYVAEMVAVFREVRRVLRDDGTVWLNLGDSYAVSRGNQGRKEGRGTQRPVNGPAMQNYQPYPDKQSNTGKIPEGSGLKPKDLIGIPWRVAFALQADGWYLRQDIIWAKPNPMPEGVRDRCTKAHEYLFLLSKRPSYYYDAKAIAEAVDTEYLRKRWGGSLERTEADERGDTISRSKPTGKARALGIGADNTRNRRSVWTVASQPMKLAHFATFPPNLIEPCILAGCPVGGHVLDPFGGAGTTGLVADRLQRRATLVEINPGYAEMARQRISGDAPLLTERIG